MFQPIALAMALAPAMLLAGCESAPPPGTIGVVEGFAGAVAADEPRAVLVARDMLSAGGSAADAAVALYFALAVTMPSTAGLGGGGACVVHDPESERTEALDFLPRPAPGGGVAVPANVRGMAALQARYGRLRWERLLSPAETLARFGTPASRAFSHDLEAAGRRLLADPEMRRVFAGPDGALLHEGDMLRQVELAAVLGQIRLRGAGALYAGPLAGRLSEAAQAIGAPLTAAALRDSLPRFRETVRIPFGNHLLHTVPPPAAGGTVALQLVRMLGEAEDIGDASATERARLFVEASARVFAGRDRWMEADGSSDRPVAELVSAERIQAMMAEGKGVVSPVAGSEAPSRPEDPWATGFAVVDKDGAAVACAVTMNGLFGSGRMAPGTGIILAAAPPERPGSIDLGPMILANARTGRLFYAAAASGGSAAPSAMAGVFLGVAVEHQPLERALKASRLHHNGSPDIVFHEADADAQALAALARQGHELREAGPLGRVNAIWCPDGLPDNPETCQARSDPRADGLGAILAE